MANRAIEIPSPAIALAASLGVTLPVGAQSQYCSNSSAENGRLAPAVPAPLGVTPTHNQEHPVRTMMIALLALNGMGLAMAAETEATVYELRTYFPEEGKAAAMHARFRDHALKLLERHHITSIGYWVPLNAPDERLVFLLSYPGRAAREASWKAFLDDADWKAAYAASEANGKLVKRLESRLFTATDYSPTTIPAAEGPRVFELRTYQATPGNLARLHNRFRQHTTKLFAKYGMTNVIYFDVLPDQPGADDTLIYFLAHKSEDAGKESFGKFRLDPDWIAARKASEEEGKGSLTTSPNGVQSLYLKATDYSPLQ